MKEKYYKIKKEYAERAGLNEHMREPAGDDHLMLSEKDIRMITLTVEEKLIFLLAEGDCEEVNNNDEVENPEDNGEDVNDEVEEVEPEIIEE